MGETVGLPVAWFSVSDEIVLDVVGQLEFPKRYVAATPSLILQADSPRRAARGTDRHVDQAGK
jgi:hypothetical protein